MSKQVTDKTIINITDNLKGLGKAYRAPTSELTLQVVKGQVELHGQVLNIWDRECKYLTVGYFKRGHVSGGGCTVYSLVHCHNEEPTQIHYVESRATEPKDTVLEWSTSGSSAGTSTLIGELSQPLSLEQCKREIYKLVSK